MAPGIGTLTSGFERLPVHPAAPGVLRRLRSSGGYDRPACGRDPDERFSADPGARRRQDGHGPDAPVRWASHDVLVHRSGTKRLHHSLVGDLTLAYERLDLPADPGLVIMTYSAEPGSASEEALRELERWSSTRARLSAVEAEA
jgi:hypothetical protein